MGRWRWWPPSPPPCLTALTLTMQLARRDLVCAHLLPCRCAALLILGVHHPDDVIPPAPPSPPPPLEQALAEAILEPAFRAAKASSRHKQVRWQGRACQALSVQYACDQGLLNKGRVGRWKKGLPAACLSELQPRRV